MKQSNYDGTDANCTMGRRALRKIDPAIDLTGH